MMLFCLLCSIKLHNKQNNIMGGKSTKVEHHHHYPDQGKIDKLEATIKRNQEQQKELEEKILSYTDPVKYEGAQEQLFDDYINNVGSQIRNLENPDTFNKKNVAFIGMNGVGKSSTINAIVGEEICEVDDVDCTTVIAKVHSSAKFNLFDVPGAHDTRTFFNMQALLKIKEMGKICIVYTDRIEHIYKLTRLVAACGVPLVIIRNKTETVDEAKVKPIELQKNP
eukprot:TRINITY_DN1585_c0_g4_i1.p1 TRINITY_DN1585_c0_g4~~TRINITY_DN1585_c0_g4_i1.p1  ORF type:complete len:224 (+),score=44.00 TRINITY_DN1585_c0_g4_i1:1310-1981(+)